MSERVDDPRCTPELLREFIDQSVRSTGQYPTLDACKDKFGGILSTMLHLATLKERGQLPEVPRRERRRS